MKITKVEAIELRLPESEILEIASDAQDCLVVRVHTDDGIVGIGEVDSCPRAAKAAIDAPLSSSVVSGLGRLLIGMNPLDMKVLNEKLYQSSFYYGRRGLGVHTMAGIDIALWDIAGKYYEQPIYQLLGGAFHKKIRAYASILFGRDGEETYEIGQSLIGRNFTAVKFGWGAMGQGEKIELDLLEGARRGVGDNHDLIVDAGCCWTTMTAMRRVKQLENYDILWLEEPLDQDNIEGYNRLSRASAIPIAAGEGEAGRFAWRDLIERAGLSIAQIDIARNGLTEAVRIADMAEDHGLRVVNHFYSTGINLAAGLHWLSSRKTAFICEYCMEQTPLRQELTRQKIEIDSEGYLHVPEGPGLGVELNEDVVEKYRVR